MSAPDVRASSSGLGPMYCRSLALSHGVPYCSRQPQLLLRGVRRPLRVWNTLATW